MKFNKGNIPWNKGKKMSEELRKKLSESHKGKFAGENHPMYGKHHSEESKMKMSKSKKGIPNLKLRGSNNPNFGKHSGMFGKKHSEETKRKIGESMSGDKNPWFGKKNPILSEINRIRQIGENNHRWKGNDVGYGGVHDWIRRNIPKPELCQLCAKVPPYDLANVSGKYLRKLDDWLYLCRRCHMNSDGRLFGNSKLIGENQLR